MGDRPITRPPRGLESTEENQSDHDEGSEDSEDEGRNNVEDGAEIEMDNFDVDDDCSLGLEGLSPSSSSSGILDHQQNIQPNQPSQTTKNFDKVNKSQPKVLSRRGGRSKKRTRQEALLSEVCGIIEQQQERADERFFKENWRGNKEKWR